MNRLTPAKCSTSFSSWYSIESDSDIYPTSLPTIYPAGSFSSWESLRKRVESNVAKAQELNTFSDDGILLHSTFSRIPQGTQQISMLEQKATAQVSQHASEKMTSNNGANNYIRFKNAFQFEPTQTEDCAYLKSDITSQNKHGVLNPEKYQVSEKDTHDTLHFPKPFMHTMQVKAAECEMPSTNSQGERIEVDALGRQSGDGCIFEFSPETSQLEITEHDKKLAGEFLSFTPLIKHRNQRQNRNLTINTKLNSIRENLNSPFSPRSSASTDTNLTGQDTQMPVILTSRLGPVARVSSTEIKPLEKDTKHSFSSFSGWASSLFGTKKK